MLKSKLIHFTLLDFKQQSLMSYKFTGTYKYVSSTSPLTPGQHAFGMSIWTDNEAGQVRSGECLHLRPPVEHKSEVTTAHRAFNEIHLVNYWFDLLTVRPCS